MVDVSYVVEQKVVAGSIRFGQKSSNGGEIQITDALLQQAKKGKVIAYKFKGNRFDCGSVRGYLEATNHFANIQGIGNN